MKKQIILGVKLLQYGLKAKLQLGCAALLLVIGLTLEILNHGNDLVGGFYVVLSSTFLVQILTSLDVSNMVQSSSCKKKLQTTMPILLSTPIQLAAYTFLVLLRLHSLSQIPADDIESRLAVKTSLAGVIALTFIFSVYLGFAYKFYVASIVIIVLSVVPLVTVLSVGTARIGESVPMAAIVVSGYLLIPAGQLLSLLFSSLTYKKELSKYAFGTAMRREMK
jgi:hypothetical protein